MSTPAKSSYWLQRWHPSGFPSGHLVRVQLARTSMLVLVLLLAVASGCATTPPPVTTEPPYDVDLAAGVPLFNERVSANDTTIPPATEVLALTDEMRRYLDRLLSKSAPASDRAERLVRLLVRDDFFPEGYYTNTTLTAAELFEERSGNCLSYTNLFVAMARHVGLDARFQIAKIPATWSADSGYLVRSRHINVLIRNGSLKRDDWVTVDFNRVASSRFYPHRPVGDEFALSSFYNNLAVDKLYEKNYRASVALINAAIKADPYNSDAWVNLAAVYSRNDNYQAAVAALETALRFEADNESALSGLVRLHTQLGNPESAARYASEMESRRERNPYFHFALAQAAYEQGKYPLSEAYANAAIDLRSRSGLFYYTRALAQYQQGKLESASASLALAQQRARSLPGSKQRHALDLAERINAERGINLDLGVTPQVQRESTVKPAPEPVPDA